MTDDPGQCEAKCDPSASYGSRYALLPDGTPCTPTIPNSTVSDIEGYPRNRGLYGLCARGYCEVSILYEPKAKFRFDQS